MAAVDFPCPPFEFARQIIISCVRYHIVIMFGQSCYVIIMLSRDLCTHYVCGIGPLTRLLSHAVSGLISLVSLSSMLCTQCSFVAHGAPGPGGSGRRMAKSTGTTN